jgi:hypothetical protein
MRRPSRDRPHRAPPERSPIDVPRRRLVRVHTDVLEVDTARRRIVDLTDAVRRFCFSYGDGLCNVFVPHATAGVTDGSDVCGIGVFAATVDDTTAIMNDDPGVAAGVFTYEVRACRGFPGDALP